MAEARDITLAHKISGMLNKHYPAHLWAVNVNSQGGVVDIKDFASSMQYGYRLLYKDVERDHDLKCCIKAGGEILERSGMKRGKWDGQLPTHIEGVRDKHQPKKMVDGKILL